MACKAMLWRIIFAKKRKSWTRERKMIEPFVDRQVRNGTISYGLSSFGYDIFIADEFRIFTPATGAIYE